MAIRTIAFLGDIFGAPGRTIVRQQLPRLRVDHHPDLIIANAENARHGSGLSPDIYADLREMGIDGITLGDHCYRDSTIRRVLQKPGEPILRPANLSSRAVGRRFLRVPLAAGSGEARGSSEASGAGTITGGRSLFVITVLGRVFMSVPANDPFATVDELLIGLPEQNPLVIVEAHMEATSEKAALAHYLDGRVAAVLGSHTHVPTADARILPGGTAFITDLGMCGPRHSIIGSDVDAVVEGMTSGMYVPYRVGAGDERMCGAIVKIDEAARRAVAIERFEYA